MDNPPEENKTQEYKPDNNANTEELPPSAAVPPLMERYGATLGLIALLVAVYVLSTWPHFQHPNPEALVLGAFQADQFRAGEWWRVITANLLHADPAHLFNNLFGIFIFGRMLEPALGCANMTGLFILSGLLAMVFSDWFLPAGASTLGASGIDFGLIGAYITLILLMRRRTNPAVFRQEIRSALLFVLIFGVWHWLERGEVNPWGHLGGFVGGVLFAVVLVTCRSK